MQRGRGGGVPRPPQVLHHEHIHVVGSLDTPLALLQSFTEVPAQAQLITSPALGQSTQSPASVPSAEVGGPSNHMVGFSGNQPLSHR